jgi:hypothetical protein
MAPHGSLSLRASLRGQSAMISSVHELFVAAVFRDQSGKHLVARSPALGALDPEHIELADQIAEDDGAVAGHSPKISASHFDLHLKHLS